MKKIIIMSLIIFFVCIGNVYAEDTYIVRSTHHMGKGGDTVVCETVVYQENFIIFQNAKRDAVYVVSAHNLVYMKKIK